MSVLKQFFGGFLVFACSLAIAQQAERVVDIPTRPGVTQRLLVAAPPEPKATLVLLAGGHGGLQIFPNGSMRYGDRIFLVRSRQLFVEQGLAVAVVDTPSDRQVPPFLRGFRQSPEHVADLKATISWLRETFKAPVWLVGTSRGTQSAAHVTSELSGAIGPDGLVLTSTVLVDTEETPVLAMALDKIKVPVLVAHHERDACAECPFSEVATLMDRFPSASKKHLLVFTGGNTKGPACGPLAYHGFNGIEHEVARQVAGWVLSR